MGKIDLLLATYNGARYLPAQIRSLQNQTYDDWTLYVHDDGSTDATLDVVRRFAAADARIRLVDDGRRFGSPADNFLHLLSLWTTSGSKTSSNAYTTPSAGPTTAAPWQPIATPTSTTPRRAPSTATPRSAIPASWAMLSL